MSYLERPLRYLRTRTNLAVLQRPRSFTKPRFKVSRAASSTISTSHNHDYEDFYRYDSGRWLWDEDAQLRDRYKRFNIPQLKKIAADSVGAMECVSMIKLAESGFNKVFRLVMDNESVVIAHIPDPKAGPPFMTTASEVATMEFARSILDIPVPKVLSWSGKAGNPVEAEYILMEEAVGTQLGEIWDGMNISSKFRIVENVVTIEKKLLSISFSRYGNLYFASDAFLGCERAEPIGDLPKSLKQAINERFVLGPVADREFWPKDGASMDIDRGPWRRSEDYLQSVGHREIARLRTHPTAKPPGGLLGQSEAQQSPQAHISLYERFLKVTNHLLPKDELARPTLWHWDIHAPNLFVQGDKITSLIGWQDVWAGPLFLQVWKPRLVRYDGEALLELPEHYNDLKDDEGNKARIRDQLERSIVQWAYDNQTKSTNPIIHEASNVNQVRNIRELVSFSSNTWDEDIIPFRQCLIRVERHWNEINSEIPCPIHFTHEEIQAHLRDGEGWNEIADFWDSLQGFVQRDGWTSNENYEQALDLFVQLREQGLQSLTGEEREQFERTMSWAVKKV